MMAIVPRDYLLNMESLLEWVVSRWGFNVSEGIPKEHVELKGRHF